MKSLSFLLTQAPHLTEATHSKIFKRSCKMASTSSKN
uniref:Uncharacterized protein n=1 Tax=Picea sitchensis TaxID=3332 RepID=A9P1F6_PICSI|nr:unknown [Picea sitchensis]